MSSGLETQPGATTIDLDDLVELAWNGRIRVPHFQRDFRWTREDVVRLFDSIVKRYPVGSLLLWRRPAPAQRVTLGALAIEAPKADHALWVVDGQQRIISLANALHDDGTADPRFALAYDVRASQIVSRPVIENPYVIPLPVIFDLARVLEWFADHPEAANYQSATFELVKNLRKFSIPAYQVVEEGMETVLEIFTRINSYGTHLTRAEIFSALNAGSEDNPLNLERIADRIADQLKFGRLDTDTVFRAILARRGADLQRDVQSEFDENYYTGAEFPDEDRDTAWAAGEEALLRAVRFVQSIGVPHFTFLPYRYLLVVLARVFAHHPELDPVNSRRLGHWFWRAALLGPEIFTGSTTRAMRILCAAVRPHDLTGSLDELLHTVDNYRAKVPDLDRFRTGQAATKIALCSWWEREPRSPDTGERFEQPQLAETLIDRANAADAVPAFFAHRSIPEPYRFWAANRILLPVLTEPVQMVAGVFSQRPPTIAEDLWVSVLRSHSISSQSAELLAADDAESFLQTRQADLQGTLDAFLRLKCEWDFEDTPPLDDLLIEDLVDEEGDDAA